MPVEARRGRPPKVDDAGVATRQRLLGAAIAACVEHGYEAVTVNDVAARAEVSAPAIYHHFGGKDELLVAAGRWALDRLRPEDGAALERRRTSSRVPRPVVRRQPLPDDRAAPGQPPPS